MFRVVANRTFTHVITVVTPVDGGYEEETVKVTYNFIDTDEAAPFDFRSPSGTMDFLIRVVNKLDDLVDEKKKPILYNNQVRDQLFKMPNVRQALCAGYFDAVSKAKSGN